MSGILSRLLGSAAAAAITDAYFNLTTLLLNTSSTNGAQNNTFLDSSTNNFTITRNGNTTQGTFTPFSQTGWSNYFGGSDYLSFTSSANFAFGTGDYTVETWVYLTSTSTYQTLFGSATTDALMFNIYSMNEVVIQTAGSNIFATFSGATFATNTWYHVAVSRSSGTVKAFVNGVQYGSTITSNTTNYAQPSSNSIGANSSSQYFSGYLSNLRVNKGTAVYTSAFTPSTTPLTAISGTSLLTCQSNRFLDSSTNAIALTVNGNSSVQAFSPFAPTAAYDAAVVGGSGYFDGTGDYLSLAATSAFAWGTGDITIECWLYLISTGSDNGVWDFRTGDSGQLFLVSNSLTSLQLYVGGASAYSFSINPNAWNHIAVVRNSGTLKTYLNGVQVGSVANTTNFTATAGCNICSFFNGTQVIGAYISNFRAVKGTAVYTAAFTPPTAPLTAITNTSLLTNFTNAGIFDSAAKNVLETVGNAQVSTTQAKWGTTSMSFPASNGNWCVGPNNPALFFGTGAFTVEMWVYPTAFTNASAGLVGVGVSGSGSTSWNIEVNTSGTVLYRDAGLDRFSSSSNLSTNTWTHIAVVRTSSAVTMYFNGTSVGTYSTINNISYNSGHSLFVGTGIQSTSTRQYVGFIDDLRITSGYARYTANFTAPTAAFPLQ